MSKYNLNKVNGAAKNLWTVLSFSFIYQEYINGDGYDIFNIEYTGAQESEFNRNSPC